MGTTRNCQKCTYLWSSLVAIRLETFLSIPPPLSMMAKVFVWLRYVSVPTRNARAPSTAHMSALFPVQCADKFHKALRTLFRVDS